MEPLTEGAAKYIKYHMMNTAGQKIVDDCYNNTLDVNGRTSSELSGISYHDIIFSTCCLLNRRMNLKELMEK